MSESMNDSTKLSNSELIIALRLPSGTGNGTKVCNCPDMTSFIVTPDQLVNMKNKNKESTDQLNNLRVIGSIQAPIEKGPNCACR